MKLLILGYGLTSYAFFLVTSLYSIGFTANYLVPKGIDSGEVIPMQTAALINMGLLGLFAIPHTLMARPAFKEMINKVIPESAERSTYVLVGSALLANVFYSWKSMPGVLWDLRGGHAEMIILSVFALGWVVVLISTFMIGHLELFGLTQVFRNFTGTPMQQAPFGTPGLYRIVRHPIMTGFIIAFWATPQMTYGHLLFAVVTTAYVFVAVPIFEERDLIAVFGKQYEEYRSATPTFFPVLRWPGSRNSER